MWLLSIYLLYTEGRVVLLLNLRPNFHRRVLLDQQDKVRRYGWCLSTATSDSVRACVAYSDALIQSSRNDKAAALMTLHDTVIDHFALAASLAGV
jgi:hypothetical protein